MPTNATMDLEEFHKQLADAPLSFHRRLREYLRRPSERNACYITGYVAALDDARLFKTDDSAYYWLALIDWLEGNDALGRELIAKMDNPPGKNGKEPGVEASPHAGPAPQRGDADIAAQAAEIEALRAERDALREALEDIRSRMRLDPFDRLAELDNIHQIADAALSKENSND